MSTLSGQIALVTGAGRGIGRAITLALAAAGARVVVADRRAEWAAAVAREVQAGGSETLPIAMDVTQPSDCARAVRAACDQWGALDILVANAGIQRRYFVPDLPPAEFQDMLDVNLMGVFNCCQAALPLMYAQGHGNVILINSNSGKRGFAFNAAYCASKFAVLGFMESLAEESRARHVRVNAVCPAGVKTGMGDDLREADGTLVDMTNFMEPAEVADVVVFLASDHSRAIHGQSLNVYGGVG
jgi:3-oxoacyl-[acyl-carrier protein] reductase